MQELFREKHYVDLDGGILEGFGRLLKYDLKLYVYPTLDDKTGELITAENLQASGTSACHTTCSSAMCSTYAMAAMHVPEFFLGALHWL